MKNALTFSHRSVRLLLALLAIIGFAQANAATVKFGDTIRLTADVNGQDFQLHSWGKNFSHEKTSGQQQVSAWKAQDDNDWFIVMPEHGRSDDYKKGEAVKAGDTLRLRHKETGKELHSHDINVYGHPAPNNEGQEVTCYDPDDANDNWVLVIRGKSDGEWETDDSVNFKHKATKKSVFLNIPGSTFDVRKGTDAPGQDFQNVVSAKEEDTPSQWFYVKDIQEVASAEQKENKKEEAKEESKKEDKEDDDQLDMEFFALTKNVMAKQRLKNTQQKHTINYGDIIELNHVYGNVQIHANNAFKYNNEGGSGQVQVQGWTAPGQEENFFIVKGADGQDDKEGPVKSGDIIRLEHKVSKMNLHSHASHQSPNGFGYEITLFGSNGKGDSNDNWVLMVMDDDQFGNPAKSDTEWTTRDSVNLYHHNSSDNKSVGNVSGKRFLTWGGPKQMFDVWTTNDKNSPKRHDQFELAGTEHESHWFVSAFHKDTPKEKEMAIATEPPKTVTADKEDVKKQEEGDKDKDKEDEEEEVVADARSVRTRRTRTARTRGTRGTTRRSRTSRPERGARGTRTTRTRATRSTRTSRGRERAGRRTTRTSRRSARYEG
ncbi:MAG: hypothetical protein H6679_00385 [Epsilonproteobacteria bacterium]|nr:hypothetical protein [Campylobacterota bacterium]